MRYNTFRTTVFSNIFLIFKLRPDVIIANNERSFLSIILPSLIFRIPVIWYIKNLRKSFFVDAFCLLFASRVFTIAPQCIDIKGPFFRFFKYKVKHLPIGIPLEDFTRISYPSPSTFSMNLLMLCTIVPEKGLLIALDLMRIIKTKDLNIKLTIAGSIPRNYDKFANSLIIKSNDLPIEWIGWHDNVSSLYNHSDVVILPSLSEGVPRSLVEAMAAGRPVIASRVGGIPSLIKTAKTVYFLNQVMLTLFCYQF